MEILLYIFYIILQFLNIYLLKIFGNVKFFLNFI